jgi:hypothetical protein
VLPHLPYVYPVLNFQLEYTSSTSILNRNQIYQLNLREAEEAQLAIFDLNRSQMRDAPGPTAKAHP